MKKTAWELLYISGSATRITEFNGARNWAEVGETVVYSGMDEGENYEREVGLILSKDAAQSLLE